MAALEIADQACVAYAWLRFGSSAVFGTIFAIMFVFMSVTYFIQGGKYVKNYNSTVKTVNCTGRQCKQCNGNRQYKRCYFYRCFDCRYGITVPQIEGTGTVINKGVKSILKTGSILPVTCTKDGLNDCITELHSYAKAVGFSVAAIVTVVLVIVFGIVIRFSPWVRRFFCLTEAVNTIAGSY